VWFGYTNNQLAVLEGDRVRVLGPNEGIRVGNISAIHGRASAIWIGGEFGLQQFDGGAFHTITAVNPDSLRGISGIVGNSDGDLWLNGNFGIFHISQTEISSALKNPTYGVVGEHFGRREGMPGFAGYLRPLTDNGRGQRWTVMGCHDQWPGVAGPSYCPKARIAAQCHNSVSLC
jgi:hypothetical protein